MALEILGITPPALTTIEKDQDLVFDLRGASPLGVVTVCLRYPRSTLRELAACFDPTESTNGFQPGFSASTVVEVSDPGYHRWRYTLRRSTSWPGPPSIDVTTSGGD